MCNTEIDQTCFLATVDHVHFGAQQFPGGPGERAAVLRQSQGVSAHHPRSFRFDTFQQLGETGQAIQAPLNGLVRESPVLQACAELNFFSQCLHGSHLPVLDFGNNQVKGVAAEVNRGQLAAVREWFLIVCIQGLWHPVYHDP
jgi:hypothetical protein